MSFLTNTRSAGVLLHVSSLPSEGGIGDLGPRALEFVDLLATAGIRWWQWLPLNPPDASNSPYSATSAFAGNPYFISLEALATDGLLEKAELSEAQAAAGNIDFARMKRRKWPLLLRAAERLLSRRGGALRKAFDQFCAEESSWLNEYALFMALKAAHPGRSWTAWRRELVRREKGALITARMELRERIDIERALQFLFFRQLAALRQHAKTRGVRLMGDVPIYVAFESADVWSNPHLFELDRAYQPRAVAGVPPDVFSKTGQRWGNPLYDWNAMRSDGYAWWAARLRAAMEQADAIRIDHFRGLAGYWRIPASSKTAEQGKWVRGPGSSFLEAMRELLGDVPLVAEDLGLITPDVIELRDEFHLPGMQILQLAFAEPHGTDLPHNYVRNLIAYTGNHDNDTTAGWFRKLPAKTRSHVLEYAPEARRQPVKAMLRLVWASVAALAIAPMQDLLALHSRARMNFPGQDNGNWRWRVRAEHFNDHAFALIDDLNRTYFRQSDRK
jgi:4-alpha-glucanotransferase